MKEALEKSQFSFICSFSQYKKAIYLYLVANIMSNWNHKNEKNLQFEIAMI